MTSMKRFCVLGAVAAALLPAVPCGAAFENLWLVNYDCNPPGLAAGHQVWRVYARFSDPGDRLTSVFGSAASPATITSTGGFYQHPFGGVLAPDAEAVAKVPVVEWDTFCTIGVAQDDGTDQTGTNPGFPSLPVSNNTNMGWFVPPAGIEQGAPDSSGKVLICQLTLLPGSSIAGFQVGLTYRPAGSPGTVTINNVSFVLLPLTAGDVNHDLNVNMDDLLLILNNWGATGQGIPDANDDGVVNIDDLLIVVNHWGFFTGSCS